MVYIESTVACELQFAHQRCVELSFDMFCTLKGKKNSLCTYECCGYWVSKIEQRFVMICTCSYQFGKEKIYIQANSWIAQRFAFFFFFFFFPPPFDKNKQKQKNPPSDLPEE